MKKAFTLIELLGVIIILAIVALITFPIIDNSIQKSRESALERTIENIERAAYSYSVEYDLGYPNELQVLELSELISKGFINKKDHINPVTDKELQGCVLYRWYESTNQYYFKYVESCQTEELVPTMTLVYDKNYINENGWINRNIMVNINGTGSKYYYCVGNSECEPTIEENKSNGSQILTSEGTNVVCAKAVNSFGESEVACTEELKIDKTKPTVGEITINGTLGQNNWYTSDVNISVSDGSDSLSGYDKTVSSVESITSNTKGTMVYVVVTDLAGNSQTEAFNIKIDKDSPTITAKEGTVEIKQGTSNPVSNYFNVSYGISGGSISCNPNNTNSLGIGIQTLRCTVTGGNGLTRTASKEIEVIPLTNLIYTLLKQYHDGNKVGLVKDNTNPNLYYYTGTNEQVSNNFLWYGGHQWRVLEFDTKAKTLTLITQQPLTVIQPSSSAWTSKSAYDSSYINSWLNDYFWNSLDISIQKNILTSNFNVGIYTNVSEITTTQKVGLLNEQQYIRAGNDNSYLDLGINFWLGNRSSSSDVRYVTSGGNTESGTSQLGLNIRPVIKISDITIIGGTGSLTNSYRTASKATSTSNVQVGEYINVPYSGSDNACESDNMCTFRVVSKDNDSIKVTLNGMLPTPSIYGNSAIIATNHTIYTQLTKFANNISTNYRYTGNKVFYIGDYPDNTNYKNINDEVLSANVGLPIIGEMFSGNDIELSFSSTKTFVDVNTIENPTINYTYLTIRSYWTMNRDYSPYVRCINYSHYTSSSLDIYANGTRPVIYLKLNLQLTGDGTAQNPYRFS